MVKSITLKYTGYQDWSQTISVRAGDTTYVSPSLTPKPTPTPEDCISFNSANIEVKQIQGRWKIVEGTHWIMDFADNENEARQAFDIIKKYYFDNICFVGRSDPSMTYFRK